MLKERIMMKSKRGNVYLVVSVDDGQYALICTNAGEREPNTVLKNGVFSETEVLEIMREKAAKGWSFFKNFSFSPEGEYFTPFKDELDNDTSNDDTGIIHDDDTHAPGKMSLEDKVDMLFDIIAKRESCV